MGSTLAPLVAALSISVGLFATHPQDKHGWALRVYGFSVRGPYLVGEVMESVTVQVALFNRAKVALEHDPLPVTRQTGDLKIDIKKPRGASAAVIGWGHSERDPFTQPVKLQPGEFSSANFGLIEFGHLLVREVGLHRVETEIKIGEKVVKAPSVTFEVVEVPSDGVLDNHPIPVEGSAARVTADQRVQPVVQQVFVGKRTLLIYRHFNGPAHGGTVRTTVRIVELPSKVEGMKVEGAYGTGKPLTITYKDTNSPIGTTKLVINSTDGLPWTEEEEKLLREREAARIAPAPRPVKP